jgi:hypothetical protein
MKNLRTIVTGHSSKLHHDASNAGAVSLSQVFLHQREGNRLHCGIVTESCEPLHAGLVAKP